MLPNNGVEEGPQDAPGDPAVEMDLDELAKEVFKLLLQELALENDRTGRT